MIYRKIIFLLIIMLINISVQSQFYNTGQERASTKWLQINTPNFRLVFPDFAQEKAINFAQKLEWATKNVPIDLTQKTTKIDIIMHMESSTSNAMVVWAPKRMETHSIGGQNSYAEDWFEQLALHEYRHVVQIDKLNMGFTKIISLVFGEMGTSVVLGAYIPLWYLEGDAVAIETALSETGRGRMADFERPLKAQLIEKGQYSYDKATMGSFKDFVPDHYILGYHLVALGKKNFGADIWKNAEEFTARNPYYVVPFAHIIHQQSGLRKKEFYDSCMQELTQEWNYQPSYFQYDTLVSNPSKEFTSYQFGQMLNDSILVALKSGIDNLTQFIIVNIYTQKESKLLTPGYSYFYNISLIDSILTWSERRYHPRWEQVKYQVVMTYDFRTKKKKQLTHKSNYFAPVIHPSRKEIACLKYDKSGNNSIIILSTKNGEILHQIPKKYFIKSLVYSTQGDAIFFFQLKQNGFELIRLGLSDLSEEIIIPASYNNRNGLVQIGNSLFYTDDESGITNIHVINLQSRQQYQFSDLRFGSEGLNTYQNRLLFGNYTANGWQVCSSIINEKSLLQKPFVKSKKINLYESYITDSLKNIQAFPPIDQPFEIKNYSKLSHLLNVHSWGPVAIDVNNMNANPGLSFMSQNLLSSMELSMGYEYVLNESVNRYFADISYTGWHPRISFNASYQDRRGSYKSSTGTIIPYTWNETNTGITISEGLNLSKGQFINYLRPLVGLNLQYLGANNDTPTGFPSDNSIASLRYGIYFSSYRKYGIRDLNPRWGQSIHIEYKHTPIGSLDFGDLLLTEARLWLPGIGKHHNMRVYFGYQQKNAQDYLYSNIIQFPRGYVGIEGNKLQSYQWNYDMPLFYPDWSISSLTYIKRVKATLFADYAISNKANLDAAGALISDKTYYKTLGIDLRFDLHILRIIAPLDLGIRSAYLPENQSYYFQFLFNVQI